MKRKVVKQGPATLMVSLPSKWVKNNNILAGQEINIEEKDASLLLSMDSKLVQKEIDISINTSDEITRRIIGALYKKGYSTIRITSKNPDIIQLIKNRIHTKIGYEVIESKKESCIIKTIANIDHASFDDMISKFFNVLITIITSTKELLDKREKPNWNELDDILTKLYNYCSRILESSSSNDSLKYGQTILVREGFYLGRYIIDAAKEIEKGINIKENSEVKEIILAIETSLKSISSCYYSYSNEKMDSLSKEISYVLKKMSKIDSKNSMLFGYLFTIMIKLKEIQGPIIDMKIDNMIIEHKFIH